MSKEARALKNAYYRDYRRKHPDRIKAAQERYWQRKVEELQRDTAQATPAEPDRE